MRLPRQKGVEVFLALDGVRRLCRHGETHSAISKWKADPASLRPKTSCCDCQNCDGLTASRRAQVPEGWQPPSYYEILCALDTEQVAMPGGRAARQIPYTSGISAAFMLPSGQIRCRHGNSESTLRRIKGGGKPISRPCGCVIGASSWRRCRLGTLKPRTKCA